MDIVWNMLRIERVFCLLFFFLRATGFFLVGFSWCFSQRSVKLHRGFEDGKDYRLEAAFTSRQGSNGHLVFLVFCDFEKSAKMGLIYTYTFLYTHIYLYTQHLYIYIQYIYLFLFTIHMYSWGFACVFFWLFLLVYWKLLKGTGSAYRWYILCTVTSCDFQILPKVVTGLFLDTTKHFEGVSFRKKNLFGQWMVVP